MVRISGRHANVYVASPHLDASSSSRIPLDTGNRDTDFNAVGSNPAQWVNVGDWVRSIDLNTSGATEQVTGLNKKAHERIKLLSDLTGTINGTIGTAEASGVADRKAAKASASAEVNEFSPRRDGGHASQAAAIANAGRGDESAYVFSNASNSDFSYDLKIEFGQTNRIRLLAEVLFTTFNIQRADDGSLRFSADFELAGGEPAVWQAGI